MPAAVPAAAAPVASAALQEPAVSTTPEPSTIGLDTIATLSGASGLAGGHGIAEINNGSICTC